ncbi:MAG: HlyD family efflux transporter periplasmic adaptor subunit [bacterium]
MEQPHAQVKEAWYKTKRAQDTGKIIGGLFLAAFVYWFIYFMPFVATEDARVDAEIINAENLGASGQVISVSVKEGDMVQKDQILAELDHRMAQANYDKAKAKADMTATDLRRAEAMLNGISKQSLDRARNDAAAAKADFVITELALERTYIKSPTSGIVIQKTAQAGNLLEGNQVAFTITDIDKAWISANIQEKSVGDIKPGQKVFITIDEGGKLTGKVTEVRKSAASVFALIPSDNASGNFVKMEQRIPIRIELDPHPNTTLRVGASVGIKIKIK